MADETVDVLQLRVCRVCRDGSRFGPFADVALAAAAIDLQIAYIGQLSDVVDIGIDTEIVDLSQFPGPLVVL